MLWVRCQSHVRTSDFFQQALAQGVSFAPGTIFSPSGKYANYMRISYGVQWNEQVKNAIKILGKLVFEYSIKTECHKKNSKEESPSRRVMIK